MQEHTKPSAGGGGESTSATVSARLVDHLLLELEDGRGLQVPLFGRIHDLVAVGDALIVYFDRKGRLLGWYLPDTQIGIDLRAWEGDT